MQYHIITIVIFLVGMQLTPTWTFQCYFCTGGDGSACYDKFDMNGAGVTTMDAPGGWCVKVKGEAFGIKSINRASGDSSTCTKVGCVKNSVPIIGDATQCCCNTDLCNSTGRLSATMTVGIILSLFVLAFKKFMF